MANGKRNPYVGIDSFTEEDSDYFFGRDEESLQLTSLLIAHQVVLFYAQSGAGKTSLLQARIIPSLRRQEEMEVLPIARVGGDLPPGVRPANVYVFNALYSMAGAGTDPQMLADVSLREGLGPYLERRSEEEDTGPALLVVDQFEELFTAYPERYEERTGFFLQVRECLEAYPHLGLLICMREDFIAPLDFYAALVPDRLRIRYRMERLDQHQAREAVEGPAARAGRPFEEGVAQTLVDDLRRIQLATTAQTVEPEKHPLGAYVEPLYLQIVCQRLWERLTPGKKIGPEDVKKLGDVDQALIDLYEESLDKALQEVKDTDCDEGRLREWFEEELITPAGTRGLVFRGEKETGGVPNRAVDVLSQAYVLRRIPRGDDVWYELAHDRLVAPIQRSNRAWREARAQRAPLLAQAERWKQKGDTDDGLLLQGPALTEAKNWFEAHPGDLSRLEQALIQEFLKESEDAIRLQAARDQRRLLQMATLLLVAFAALAGWAIYSQHKARVAERAARSALSAAMTAEQDARSALSTAMTAEQDARSALDAVYARGTSEAAAVQKAEDLQSSQNETAVVQAQFEQATQQADLEATLVALASTSTATPTPSPSPSPTLEPLATAGPTSPGGTPTPIPTRTPLPTLTVARSPTPDWAATDTAAAVVAQVQATQTAIARCPFEPQGEFSKLWQQEGVQDRLGCPKYVNPVNTYMAEQVFDARGMMYWSQTPDLYLVLIGQQTGIWQVFWTKEILWSWNPAGVSCEPEVPPGPGEVQPVRGFGGLWCANPRIQQALGFATEKERGVGGNWLQEFERGFILRDSTGTDYLLFADNMTYSTAAALSRPTATPRPTPTPGQTLVPAYTRTPLPSLSPSGGWIAYVSWQSDTNSNEIFIMKGDGREPQRLSKNGVEDWDPVLSPDGKFIVFMSERDGDEEIYRMNRDGSGIKRLTFSPDRDRWPAFSPDGETIAFTSARLGNPEIYLMDQDGGNQRNLSRNAASDRDPAFSPDGRQIVFVSNRDGTDELYMMDSNGRNVRRLTYSQGRDWQPSFSPDGSSVLYAYDRNGNWEIYLLDLSSLITTRLTDDPALDRDPVFAPDSSRILFASDRGRSPEQTKLYLMNPDGSGAQPLTNGQVDWAPSWSR